MPTVAIVSAGDADKVAANGVRALGNLLVLIDAGVPIEDDNCITDNAYIKRLKES